VDEIDVQILKEVQFGLRDAGDIRYSLSLRPLSWPTDPADPERLKQLTTDQIETVLENLLAFGFAEYEQRLALRLWCITPAGKDALYDWDPWRFRVDNLVPGWRPRPEEPAWGFWDPAPDAVVAVGKFVGSARPDAGYQRDSFALDDSNLWGWVDCFVFLLDDSGTGAVQTDVQLRIGDVLIRRSPPPGQPRPEPVYFG
jgi:hypothetical protein